MARRRQPVAIGDDNLVRTQILLDPALYRQITALAEQEGRSLSSLVREMLADGLRLRKRRRLEQAAHALQPDYGAEGDMNDFNALDSESFNA